MEVSVMKRYVVIFVALVLFLGLALPALADDGGDHVVYFGDRIVLGPGEVVEGGLTIIGGSLEMREGSRVNEDVAVLGGEAIIDGQVAGSLVVIGGSLQLQSNALIQQDFFTIGANVSRAEGARVLGETVEGLRSKLPPLRIQPPSLRPWPLNQEWRSPGAFFSGLVGRTFRWLLRTVALMAMVAVAMALFPRQVALVGTTLSRVPLPSTGVGLLTLVALLVAIPLLVIICIGIPVAVLLAVAFVAALLLGRVAVASMLGQRLWDALKLQKTQPQPLLEAVVGIVLIELVTAVPCLGGLIGWVIGLAGLGAVVLTRFGTLAYDPLRRAEEPAVVTVEPVSEPPAGEKPEE
jgi:hypothetical protein